MCVWYGESYLLDDASVVYEGGLIFDSGMVEGDTRWIGIVSSRAVLL